MEYLKTVQEWAKLCNCSVQIVNVLNFIYVYSAILDNVRNLDLMHWQSYHF